MTVVSFSQRSSQRLRHLCVRRLACSSCRGMKAKWWSCLLGLLCTPAEVMLHTWTASQSPSTISNVWINSSLDIECTTSLENPQSLSVNRHFLGNEQILHIYFNTRVNQTITLSEKYKKRIEITDKQMNPGAKFGFRVQFSRLRLDDTDLYYCSWSYMDDSTYNSFLLKSNGTAVIVREGRPVDECRGQSGDLTLIILIIAGFSVTLLMSVAVVIVKCRKQFKKRFTPGRPYVPPLPPRPPQPSRPNQPRNVYLQQQRSVDRCPYMMTSTNDYGFNGNL